MESSTLSNSAENLQILAMATTEEAPVENRVIHRKATPLLYGRKQSNPLSYTHYNKNVLLQRLILRLAAVSNRHNML